MRVVILHKSLNKINDVIVKKNSSLSNEDFCKAVFDKVKESGLKVIAIDFNSVELGDNSYSSALNELLENLLEMSDNYISDTEDLTVNIIINGKNADQGVMDKLEEYLRIPQMTTVNHFFGEPSDPITEKFAEYEKKFRYHNEFREYLIELIDARNFRKNSEVYKACGISKSTFHKIMNYKINHRPSKETVAAIAIGLRLSLEEAQKLYNYDGYYLGTIEFVDRVVRFFISEARYDIDEVNYCLYLFRYPPLGECSREDRVRIKGR